MSRAALLAARGSNPKPPPTKYHKLVKELLVDNPGALYAPPVGAAVLDDLSGHGLPGTLKNGAAIGAGLFTGGGAVALDGVDDYVTSGLVLPKNIANTFVGVASRTNSATVDTLIGSSTGRPVLFLMEGTQSVRWNPAVTPITWAAAWPGNAQAVLFGLVFDDVANTVALYINGALVSSQACAESYAAEPTLQIGANSGVTTFGGPFAVLGAYPTALSAGRMAAYQAALT